MHQLRAAGGLQALGPQTSRRVRIALVAIAVILSKPVTVELPAAMGDNSWIYALNLAVLQGRAFGEEVIFTYGPWGYLTFPLAIDPAHVVHAAIFRAIGVAAFVGLAQYWLGRVIGVVGGSLAALALVLLFNTLVGSSWLLALSIAGWCLTWIHEDRRPRPVALAAVVLASSLLLQVKISEGATATSMVLLMLIAQRRSRDIVLGATGLVAASVLWWILSGQPLGHLPLWLNGAWTIAAGYREAMRLDTPYGWVPVALGVLIAAALMSGTLKLRPRSSGAGWFVVGAVLLLYLVFQQAFVRNDLWHQVQFFVALVTLALIGLQPRRAAILQAGAGFTALVIVVVVYPAALVTSEPATSAWAAFLSDGNHRTAIIDKSKAQLRRHYGLGESDLLPRSGARTLVEPGESTLAWAYDLKLEPLPTLEAYSAYTPALDRVNARHLLTVPNLVILRREATMDDRLQLWDSPRYNLTLLCHFEETTHTASWSRWERTENRCGGRLPSEAVRVTAGTRVAVPEAGENSIVALSYSPDQRSVLAKLWRSATRESPMYVGFSDRRFRLPRAHAAGPLIVDLPDSLRWPTAAAVRPAGGYIVLPEDGLVDFIRIPFEHEPAPTD